MKLVMTLLVRNEADIVQANIEYHLAQGVDYVITTDHGSNDGTSEILREYERMGVAKILRDDGEGHHQSDRVTRMVEIARLGHGADWVINNDADEFWWPLVGNLRDVFTAIPPCFGQIEVQRRNFRPRAGDDDDSPFYSRLIHREASSSNLVGHALEPKVAHRPCPGVVVAPGNHSVQGAELAAVPAGEVLEVLHFPMRSYEQFERKVVQTGEGYEQVSDRPPMVGRDQMALLELYRAGKLREYYDGLAVDGDALERGLQMGTLVVDRRLDDFMCMLRSGEHPRVRPDAPSARALLRRTMDAMSKVEQNRGEIADLRAENELASAQIGDLQSQISGLSASLDDATHKLESTSQALHLLRTSHLLRSTRWARRLYYRASGRQ